MSIDLTKRKEIVSKIVLEKKINDMRAQVVLVLDYSGSAEHLYQSGFIQRLVERMMPLALQFDDNGEMELYIFHNNCMRHKNSITEGNLQNFINNEIYNKNGYSFAGTSYAPVVNAIMKDFVPSTTRNVTVSKEVKKGGFLGFGSKTETINETVSVRGEMKDPVYVIFVTDGDNQDKAQTTAAIKEAAKSGVFFQFVGIGNAGFQYLEELDNLEGRFIDNANFFHANDLDKISDEQLYKRMLNEFPSFITEAKQKGLLKN